MASEPVSRFEASPKVPRKLRDISVREARAMLQEHAERSTAICGCDRCIVLMGLLRDRGYRWGTDATGLEASG